MSIFNTNQVDILTEPMFLGSDLGIARYDIQRHRVFEQLIEKSLSFFWRPEEVNLTTDRSQFDKLAPHLQEVFAKNLKYQSLMDSIQGRAPSVILGELVSDPSLDTWVQTWTFSETIHSRSYTHIMRNLWNDPSKVFDEIVLDADIMARAESISRYYDDVVVAKRDYFNALDYQKVVEEDIKEYDGPENHDWAICQRNDAATAVYESKYWLLKKIYLCLHAVNALEAIRFYVSFVFTWNFTKNMSIMEGNSKVMKLIARDEQLHLKSTQYILNEWQKGTDGPIYAQIAKECEKEAAEIFLAASAQEKEWANKLFDLGPVPGLSREIMESFVDYMTVSRMNSVNLPHSINAPKSHPLPWIREYLNSDMVQSAPQEVEISSYLISQIDSDVDNNVLTKLKENYGK
ncbi:ribonucleotide reductase of class Ia (aerobic), beta subunit [Shewanella phage Thanatos-1]|nr:ribonucleotide reductase of class Ia (aerobic), beta subunit [Shewanella phage Thanatos-1]